jgi:AcrR family transcriptional regulator
MHRPPLPAASTATHQRLLDAAARVFAEHGLAGATTRTIAEAAGVNEVTLFRHFGSKDRLLEAVVGRTFPTAADEAAVAPVPNTKDLRADLLARGREFERLLKQNLPLVRTLIGEIHHRHRDQEKQVFHGVFGTVKAAILARIADAQGAGELQREIPATLLADLFAGMIFTGVLRRSAGHVRAEYSANGYLEAAVDLVIRGAAA